MVFLVYIIRTIESFKAFLLGYMMPKNLVLKLPVKWSYHEEHTTCGWGKSSLCVYKRAWKCVCGVRAVVVVVRTAQYRGPLPSLPPKILYSGMGNSKPAKQFLAWEENFP